MRWSSYALIDSTSDSTEQTPMSRFIFSNEAYRCAPTEAPTEAPTQWQMRITDVDSIIIKL